METGEVDLEKSPDAIVKEIVSSSGKGEEEVRRLIEEKKEKFSGLLTDSGAAFMVAKELGAELKEKPAQTTEIGSLSEGMNNIDVIARVKAIYPEKEFESRGRKGKLQALMLMDSTGEIRATLWNNDIKKFSDAGLSKGSCVRFSNCGITSYNKNLQLNLNYNSEFSEEKNSGLPEIGPKKTSLSQLEPGMSDVMVDVLVKKIFPAREFENDRGKGKVTNFIIGEGSEEMRATAWNEQSEEIEKYESENIRIEGAYTKEGRDGTELHLGWNARIIPGQ